MTSSGAFCGAFLGCLLCFPKGPRGGEGAVCKELTSVTRRSQVRLLGASANSGQLWQTPANSGQLWPTLANSGQFWPTLANSGQLWPALTNSGQPWPTLANSGQLWPTLANSGQHLPTLTNSGQICPTLSRRAFPNSKSDMIRPLTVSDWPTKTPFNMCDCEPRVVGLRVLVQLRHTLFECSHYSGYLVGEI